MPHDPAAASAGSGVRAVAGRAGARGDRGSDVDGGEMKMKLSEAIRLGSMLKPQGIGPFAGRSEALKTCALGAAMNAAGIQACDGFSREVREYFPVLDLIVNDSSVLIGEDTIHNVRGVIWRLNDKSFWTRERIADWVETVEAQQEAEAQSISSEVTA